MNLFIIDTQTEALLKHLFELHEADPVNDMLVHSPTLQGMEVLVSMLITRRQEWFLAGGATMECRRAGDNLSPDPGIRHSQVVGEFGMHLVFAFQVQAIAVRAFLAPHLDRPVDLELPRSLASLHP